MKVKGEGVSCLLSVAKGSHDEDLCMCHVPCQGWNLEWVRKEVAHASQVIHYELIINYSILSLSFFSV